MNKPNRANFMKFCPPENFPIYGSQSSLVSWFLLMWKNFSWKLLILPEDILVWVLASGTGVLFVCSAFNPWQRKPSHVPETWAKTNLCNMADVAIPYAETGDRTHDSQYHTNWANQKLLKLFTCQSDIKVLLLPLVMPTTLLTVTIILRITGYFCGCQILDFSLNLF